MTHTNFSKRKDVETAIFDLKSIIGNIYNLSRETIIDDKSTIIPSDETLLSRELLTRLRRSPVTLQVLTFIYRRGAATSRIISNRLNLSEDHVCHILKRLHRWGFIQPFMKTGSHRGAKSTIWTPIGKPDPENVQKAIQEHQNLSKPKYRLADILTQELLDDYIPRKPKPEITYREILIKIREYRIPFNPVDVADIVAWKLQEHGVRVWR